MSKQDYKSNFHVVNMSDKSEPQVREVYAKDYVTNGKNNEYFRFLIELTNASNTLNACVEEVARNIYGKGLAIRKEVEVEYETDEKNWFGRKKKDKKMETEFDVEDPILEKINEIIKPSDLKAFIYDRVALGNATLKLVYNGKDRRKQLQAIKHWPVQTLAAKKINVNQERESLTKNGKDDYSFKGEVEAFYYHPRWEDFKNDDELVMVPSYGYGKGSNLELYLCRPYSPNAYYWSPAGYSGGIKYAEMEKEIGDYLLSEIQNGFSPTTLINIQRNVQNRDEKEYIAQEIKDKMVGTHGDKVLVQFNSNENEKTTFEPFPLNDAPNHYEYLSKEAGRKILSAFRIPEPKLMGLPTQGENGLGNNAKEIEVAFDKFLSTVVDPIKYEILETINDLLMINNIEADIDFIPCSPISFDKYNEREEMKMVTSMRNQEGYQNKK